MELNIPAKNLIETLEQLRKRLNTSGVERTKGLMDAMGDDCTYYRKSLDIFLKRDYDELSDLIDKTKNILENL